MCHTNAIVKKPQFRYSRSGGEMNIKTNHHGRHGIPTSTKKLATATTKNTQ